MFKKKFYLLIIVIVLLFSVFLNPYSYKAAVCDDFIYSYLDVDYLDFSCELFVKNDSGWVKNISKPVGAELEFRLDVNGATGLYLIVTAVLPGLLVYNDISNPPPHNISNNVYGGQTLVWNYDNGGGSRSFYFNAEIVSSGVNNTLAVGVLFFPPLYDSSSVKINATIKDFLPVSNPGGPYFGSPGLAVEFNGSKSLDMDEEGCCITRYDWKYLEDGLWYNDTGPISYYTYQNDGNYSVFLRVYDNEKNMVINSTYVEVSDVVVAYANGPYEGKTGEYIQFKGFAYGGTPPYSYSWDFDKSNGIQKDSLEENPSYIYEKEGIYTVTFSVIDDEGMIDTDTTTVVIQKQYPDDTIPPSVEIIKPLDGIYIVNIRILPLGIPFIIGSVDIIVEAVDDESGIDKVEFYIDGNLEETIETSPYKWRWNKIMFFRHTIKVIGYDNADNNNYYELIVWKFL